MNFLGTMIRPKRGYNLNKIPNDVKAIQLILSQIKAIPIDGMLNDENKLEISGLTVKEIFSSIEGTMLELS